MKGKILGFELLTFEDLPFSRTTAWRMMKNRKLKFYRIGRRIFFSAEHIQELLISSEVSNNKNTK